MIATGNSSNKALEPYDITEYKGVNGKNFFEEDRLLQYILNKRTLEYSKPHKDAMINHIHGYGKLVGGILNELTEASHKEGKYGQVINYDRTGKRIEKVEYCNEQIESRKISYEYGIVNLDFHSDWKHAFTDIHRVSLAYLANMNGEGGVTCPLAMTEGMILALKELGTDKQKEKYLPLVAGEKSSSHFMAGQYVTERVGGSNVGANRTIARKRGDGKWILTGEKWFCSNPGDLWVTTAKLEDSNTIGLFLVPRIKDDGELNGCYILRKKDIIGSKGKITVETVYEDLEAEELGRPAHGIANLLKYVIRISRIHVTIAALGMGQRAYMEAFEYSKVREAYGKHIIDFPSIKKTLAEMKIMQSACEWMLFKNIELREQDSLVHDLLTPLLKYISTVHSTWITREAILTLGGNGILGDFSCLPRLHNDSIINETWEGTHQVISEHVLKAYSRPKIRKALEDMLKSNISKIKDHPYLKSALEDYNILKLELDSIFSKDDPIYIETNKLHIIELIYKVMALSELIKESSSDEIFMLFATGFSEIAIRGIGGMYRENGLFSNLEYVNKLIYY